MSTDQNVNTAENSSKDFFMRLLAVIALYTCASNFIGLVDQYINSLFPSPWDYGYLIISLRWHIASFVIAFPVFLYTTIALNKECRLHPEKLNLKSRKWLINFTLFLAVVIILCDLGSLLYYFLGGEVTIRFLLKSFVLLLIMGVIFYYYLRDMKQQWTAPQLQKLLWAVVVIAIVVVAYGVYRIEKPFIYFASTSNATIPYCQAKTLPVSPDEDKVIQQVVKGFAVHQGCDAGNNCLNKWNDHGVTKFSIAWTAVCPGGGDGGNGSTFQCSYTNNQTCCWPLGFGAGRICSPAMSN